MGAWIEIDQATPEMIQTMSLPSWERGLKFRNIVEESRKNIVAPFMGAWIEIMTINRFIRPYQSLPSWERGLKFVSLLVKICFTGRSLHGSVD